MIAHVKWKIPLDSHRLIFLTSQVEGHYSMKTPLLHELFEQQAALYPDALAIISSTAKINYQKLEKLSQSLACRLISQNTKPNQLVAVVMEKGWEQVVAVLGILKAGSAYLPIDPTESKERLHYLLKTGEAQVVITQKKYHSTISWPQDNLVIAIDIDAEELSAPSLIQRQNENDLAYVIFTSGSTGTPKGVMITHQSAVNTILDINERFSVNADDKVFALSSLNFDLSVYDIFGTLAAGGTIVIPTTEQAKDPTQWYELFINEKISIWNSVPALMDMFTEYLYQKSLDLNAHALRVIMLSGDWIPLNLPNKIRSLFGDIRIISMGGATEASIWSIMYEIGEVDPAWKSIPYGKAMKNQAFYVLDEKLELVSGDELGELFIGGIGVAKGYWKDKKRTDAQFIQHPQYGMIYKTGDLGRYLPDQNIEFLGRVDFQVKIAGYRVEINAIEKYLLDFPSMKQAIVLVTKEDSHQKLVAYLNFDYSKIVQDTRDYSSLEKEQIDYWQKIYDELSQGRVVSNNDVTFNTAGWISSYYNDDIPKIQMQEWVDNTVKRISFLKPQSVLEIGCGTGLLLFRLAKMAKSYDATDLSKSSIDYVRKQLPELEINNVELIECEATKTKNISKLYDTIILNSVAQYFPSIDYLVEVLDQCVDKIESKGQIFIGDVRSLHLLNEFHASILLNKNINHLSYEEWKNILSKSVEEEDELVIDFNFFHAYKAKNPRVSHVEIMLKEGKFHNEMNCYRYDVILYLEQQEEKSKNDIVWRNWDSQCDECLNLEVIHTSLSQDAPNLFAIKNVPNKRTAGLTYLIDNDNFYQLEKWHDAFEKDLAARMSKAIDPEMFYEIANEHGYYASIAWSATNPSECFDVTFVKHRPKDNSSRDYLFLLENKAETFEQYTSWTAYANLPLLPRINRKLISEVKDFLHARLPKYMIPSYFVPIKELPITANGKIDRKALPVITHRLSEKEYIRPYTDTQKSLVAIWQKILGMQFIGIRHNFYDIGGTSLLSIQLIIDIHEVFGVDLSLQQLTACTLNVENLSSMLEKQIIPTCELVNNF